MQSLSALLASHPVFASLSEAEVTALHAGSISHSYDKGEYIALAGDIWPYLFIVAKGAIHALKESGAGRSLLVTSLEPGEIFWGLAFFEENMPMPVGLYAAEPAAVYLWPRERLLPLLLKNGRLSWELSRLMVQRMMRASAIVDELAFQPLTGRVARLLLDNFPSEMDAAPRHLTLDEMAARIGSTREMVCRVLYRFAEEGAIRINRTEFVFTNRDLLQNYSRQGMEI
jgi:CRP/FNR family transcriptional regulator